jgi:hypothetical protein
LLDRVYSCGWIIAQTVPCLSFDLCLSPIFEDEGAGRADNNALAAFPTSEFTDGLVAKSGNHPLKATVGKTEGIYPETLLAYPHTAATQDTLIRVIDELGVAVIYGEFAQNFPETL